MKVWPVLLALIVVVGCTKIKYLGEEYPPTTHVDVYFSEFDVEQDYKVMGHATATAPEFVDVDKMLDDIKKKAMEKGADAIIVLGLDENIVSESTYYQGETKTEGDKTKESGSTTTTTSKENEIKVLFLKYKTSS